jgi:transmembrane sensor
MTQEFSSDKDRLKLGDRLEELLYRLVKGEITDEEHQELRSIIDGDPDFRAAYDAVVNPDVRKTRIAEYAEKRARIGDPEKGFERFAHRRGWHQKRAVGVWALLGVAASVLMVLGGVYLFVRTSRSGNSGTNQPAQIAAVKDIAPGKDKAVLTLADGRQVDLDSAGEGLVATQGGTTVSKRGQGELTYRDDKDLVRKGGQGMGAPVTEPSYNTLSTPNAGQYHVRLPDGSVAWLNAASSLTYPTMFAGGTRTVKLTGEGYFEIAANAKAPFIVDINGTQVKVLGTHFDVMAYSDEKNLETTLLQGSVEVIHGKNEVLLHTGRQARLDRNGTLALFDVKVDDYTAWMHGRIRLNNADIEQVMRQIGRWYDVKVEYEGKSSATWTTVGTIPRTLNLSEVLKVLDVDGIHCSLDATTRTVVVHLQ